MSSFSDTTKNMWSHIMPAGAADSPVQSGGTPVARSPAEGPTGTPVASYAGVNVPPPGTPADSAAEAIQAEVNAANNAIDTEASAEAARLAADVEAAEAEARANAEAAQVAAMAKAAAEKATRDEATRKAQEVSAQEEADRLAAVEAAKAEAARLSLEKAAQAEAARAQKNQLESHAEAPQLPDPYRAAIPSGYPA